VDFLKKNRTIEAIEAHYPSIKVEVIDELPFSSERKISATRIRYEKDRLSLWLGAPEALTKKQITEDLKKLLTQYRDQGLRVLLFASTKEELPARTNLTLLALIIVQDELRADIKEAINFYESRHVKLKILSGDHPNTVLAIAKQAGFSISGKVINGRDLDALNEQDFKTSILDGQIFGNLLPKDKVRIIEKLQRNGEYVGMIGDGVNDVLALKQADIGIAMHSGAAAARDVADVTLLQDAFTHLPNLSKEGDHIIYNIKRIAKLFITKNIYILFFVLFAGFIGLEFPLTPRTITWIDALTIGIPTVLLTLMTPTLKAQTAKNFVLETLQFALLTGVIIAMASLFVYAYFYLVQDRTFLYGKTASISVIVLMNLYVVNYLAMPERKKTPHLQFWFIIIILLCAFILHIIALDCSLTRYFIGLTSLDTESWIIVLGTSLVGLLILKILSKRFGIALGG
jgi:cation-transporting P-type ATPase E